MAIFEFTLCDESFTIPVEFDGTPFEGQVYAATGNTGLIVCGIIGNLTVGTPIFTASTPYTSCLDCLEENIPSKSANTEYIECLVCWNASGSTVHPVDPPHPVWTGIYGESITQMNAVTLGGPNGLNS